MDSARNTCHKDEESEEKIQDNRSLRRDLGQHEMDENLPRSLIMEIYPWISQFRKMCRSSITERSISSLKILMKFYLSNVRPSVNECHTKPLRAEKLKDSISEALLFFLYYYRDIGDLKARDYYLIVMSDLLAMYIDMELKASKKGSEHCSRISARLSSSLHVYLEHSTEHLLDTLLKVHFMTHNYCEILDPVITKVFKLIDDHPSSSMMYVRYFLAYRLWKKLNKDVSVRNRINLIAVTSLGAAPSDLPPFVLQSVLPQVPKTQKFSTKLLLLQKFDVEKSCEEFLNHCNKERGLKTINIEDDACWTSTIVSLPEDNNDCHEPIINNNNLSIITNNVTSSNVNFSTIEKNNVNSIDKTLVTKKSISSNVPSFRRGKKSNDIVFIDLTSDTVKEKVIRNKKTRRKLSWLEEAKKRLGTKINTKKDSTIEDLTQPEDSVDMRSLHIQDPESPSSKMDIPSERVSDERVESAKSEDEVDDDTLGVISIETKNDPSCTVTNNPINKSSCDLEWSQLERQKNEKNRVEPEEIDEEVSSSLVQVLSIENVTSTSEKENRVFDQYPNSVKVDETRISPLVFDANMVETSEKFNVTSEDIKDKTLVDDNLPVGVAIKPEHATTLQPNEILNESLVETEMEVQVAEYASEVSVNCEETSEPKKIRDVEFQENIDGLSLLASVSQRISHLTTASINDNPVELIKVKNYALLADPNPMKNSESSNNQILSSNDRHNGLIDTSMDIYSEDAMDKVAYQVEISSTNDADLYENCEQPNDLSNYSISDEARCNNQSQVGPDSTNLPEKDDVNVILNGETVVLYQKSPNSNLYIINKAVENRDHINDEVASHHRDMTEHMSDPNAAFTYDIYDSIYRNQAASYDISQYNRELSSQESRRGKMVKPEKTGDIGKVCDGLEISKSIKNNGLDVHDDKGRIKRKIMNSGIPRRRRIKQEYNDCSANLSGHMKTSYGIQDCPAEHQDANRPIHIPVAHNTSISTMYTKYQSGTELYLPCHKNCNSIACGLAVNPSAALHTHSGTNATRNTRCSCLNCTYGIVPRCAECILPNGGTRTTSIDPNAYYMPLHKGQTASVKDCNVTMVDDKLGKIYDNQLVCDFSEKIMENKPMESVKYEPKENYRAEFDHKLPLKKRFKAIMAMSFVDDVPMQCEKLQSYPGTPMISIAALEASQDNDTKNSDVARCNKACIDLTSTLVGRGEMIRRDYHKDMIMSPPVVTASSQNGHRNNSAKRKRSQNSSDMNDDDDDDNDADSYGKTKKIAGTPTKSQGRMSDKVKEPVSTVTKNSTRKTRSSKRNVPKVNYIYADGDSDWNPSGGFTENSINKRKRKRTSR